MKTKFDKVVVEIQNEGSSLASISITKNDLDTLENLHNHDFKTIIADMAQTLIEGLENREEDGL